ncbi:hypothetical protein LguiB_013382 [Lonicera macranthoides]
MGENPNRSAKNGFADDDSILFFNLPNDIFMHVFSKLPVDTILRCRCVCKQWCRLLCHPEFVRIHLNHSQNRQKFLLRPKFKSSYFKDYEANKGIDQMKKCNLDCNSYKILVGFGYDSSIKDYKLVCVIFRPRYQVQVYSLKTNSWKVIEMALLRRIGVSLSDGGIALNGSIYWLVDSGEGKFNRWIVGFDLKDDKFIEVQFPPLDPNIYCVNNLKVDGGCLGVYYSYRKKKDTFQVIMWTMNNDKKEEWTKLPTITCEEEGTKLCHFMNAELLCSSKNKKVIFYIKEYVSKIECEEFNCLITIEFKQYRVDLYSLKTIAWKKIREVPDQFDPHLEEFTQLLLPIEIRKESRKRVVELGGYLGIGDKHDFSNGTYDLVILSPRIPCAFSHVGHVAYLQMMSAEFHCPLHGAHVVTPSRSHWLLHHWVIGLCPIKLQRKLYSDLCVNHLTESSYEAGLH